ncbi:hypothetical protein GCM10028821_08360 [Hymenobacter jeollabukensis]
MIAIKAALLRMAELAPVFAPNTVSAMKTSSSSLQRQYWLVNVMLRVWAAAGVAALGAAAWLL